jgi:serine/threonine protein kinase
VSPRPDCPEFDSWQALVADSLPAGRQEHFERHLESCPACQELIDRGEEGEEALRRLARQVGDPTVAPADPTLAQALELLHAVKSPPGTSAAEPADLYFLRPSDRPGALGTLGGYQVHEAIGQGGMGVVLKAFDPALNRLVAIKVLSPALAGCASARRRFTREAQAAAAVCHEHVVAVHGVHEIDGLPYLVMQYIAGESLQERLDRVGPLPVEEVVRIGLQAASGLAAAHAQGLIHRDVKPANLLLEDGLARVKVTDFGLARTADDIGLTQNGVVAGTPEYMAPEQARGEAVDPRADLFSLGSVLYACCTGVPPFRAGTALEVLRQVSDLTPVPIRERNPEVPAWLEALIVRLLAKDPGRRFQSAAEVAALLEGYLAHLRQPALAAAPTMPSSPPVIDPGKPGMRPRMTARKWLLVIAGMGSVLGLLGALGANLVGPNEPKSLEPKDGLVCLLVNKNSGRCLSSAGPSDTPAAMVMPGGGAQEGRFRLPVRPPDTPGAKVVQGPTPDRAGAAERWTLIGTGKAFRLRNEKTQLVLEIGDANPNRGVRASQGPDQSTRTEQHWTFEPVGDAYLLRPGHCQLVLAVAESSRDEGARVIQWNYLPNLPDQLWELRSPPPPARGAGEQQQTPAGAELKQEHAWSFKGDPQEPEHLQAFGPNAEQCVRFEPEGLRIRLPPGHPPGMTTGLAVRFPVKGDFEISVNFEVLKEPEPAAAGEHGAELSLLVNLQGGHWTGAGCSRGVTADNGTRFFAWTALWDEAARDSTTRNQQVPTKAKAGQLRVVRTGSKVSCCVSEGAGTDSTLLEEPGFGPEDVDTIRIYGGTSSPQAELDVRFTDLRIKTGSGVTVPAAARRPAGPKPSLTAAGLLGLGLLLALGVCLYVRRRRAAASHAGAAPNGPAESVTAPPAIPFPCSTCGKDLRAAAKLAGKKVKCPQCGQAALVPGPAAGQADATPS